MTVEPARFQKRTYSVGRFLADVKLLVRSLWTRRADPDRSETLERDFSERIMLAVTQVNGCRYCEYGHSMAALRVGVTEQELAAIKTGELNESSAYEVPALRFAQHYAAEGGAPDDQALEALILNYGEARAARILLTIRMITIGNLLGNTFDAVLYRLRGRQVASGSVLQEISVLLLAVFSIPILLLIGLASLGSRLISKAAGPPDLPAEVKATSLAADKTDRGKK
ncbi:MAG: carboxymuconolactone decarboxylase family protein [Anaerolineales bacterium]|jgi:AhpD family alkylhydroperoxidase